MKVRIKFSKHGPIRFIGHLDVMRYFQKAMRRANIDISYSTGYSPHQIMSFAAPLGVGLESNGEYMDVELNTIVSSEMIVNKLNEVGVPGIKVLSAKVLPDSAKNAMATVAAAEYTVAFREGREPNFPYLNNLEDFFAQNEIWITKATKRSTKEIDLKLGIYQITKKDHEINMIIDASSSGNIKPQMVIEAYLNQYNEELKENALLITREETYMNIGDEETKKFVPLDEIGIEV